jgi:hypothetical protein
MIKLRRLILTTAMIIFNVLFISSLIKYGIKETIDLFIQIVLGAAIILLFIIGNLTMFMNWKEAMKQKQRSDILSDHLKKL